MLLSLSITLSISIPFSQLDASCEMLLFTEIILLGCIAQASCLAIESLPNATVSSLFPASQNSSFTKPISALNGGGPRPPELYIKTDNVRDLQNASLTKGLVRFAHYEYSEGKYPPPFMRDFLIKAHSFMESEQQYDRQGMDETIDNDSFLYADADPTGGEIHLIFQGVDGQMETKRQTTWRDVMVVLNSLVSWAALWERAQLIVPSTEIVLEVYDGHGYVVISSGFMFTIRETSQLQTT